MDRYLKKQVLKDLEKKMVWIAGPRQSGKTTLARGLLPASDTLRYMNWDDADDRDAILKRRWPVNQGLLVLDEIHKYREWRNTLKGLFDKRARELKILVTGSARLDHYRRGGDSLQGRYTLLRMHPLSLKELGAKGTQEDVEALLKLGPFPEPFLSGSEVEAKRWSRAYRTRLVREDLVSLENVSSIDTVEELMIRLPDMVGGGLSVNSLREDLAVSHVTLSRWLDILENLYAIHRVHPFGAPRLKALKKESKHYHYDWSVVPDEGPRFENMIANHLLKWAHWIEDTEGSDVELRYYRDKQQREVDFVLVRDRKPIHFIECKVSDKTVSTSLKFLKRKFPEVAATQVLLRGEKEFFDEEGIRVTPAKRFLIDWI